ncbi:hypothetical protein B0H10DRAFT_1940685 [Mycena sp. CBHHK59/15]|nr:hypothetical protein B0H10DRAFT_1940685 [Mycena sp. CBHHK59/15]
MSRIPVRSVFSSLFITASVHLFFPPVFSIALSRGTFDWQENDHFDPDLGFIAFGGIVSIPVLEKAVTLPIQGYSLTSSNSIPSNSTNLLFIWYTVDVQSYVFPGSSQVTTACNNIVIDTGSTFNYLSMEVVAVLYMVYCSAKVLPFSMILGGKEFMIDGCDQILPVGTKNPIICMLRTQDGGPDMPSNAFTLGDMCLHNIVATFNPVAAEISFTRDTLSVVIYVLLESMPKFGDDLASTTYDPFTFKRWS